MKKLKEIAKLLLFKPRIYGSCAITNETGQVIAAEELFSFTDINRKKSYFVYTSKSENEKVHAKIYDKSEKSSSLMNINTINEWQMIKTRYNLIKSRELTEIDHVNHIGRKYMIFISLFVSILLNILYIISLNISLYLPIISISKDAYTSYAIILAVQIIGAVLLNLLTDKLRLTVRSGITNAILPVNIFFIIYGICVGIYPWYNLIVIIIAYSILLSSSILNGLNIKCLKKSSYFYRIRFEIAKEKLFYGNILFFYNLFVFSFIGI